MLFKLLIQTYQHTLCIFFWIFHTCFHHATSIYHWFSSSWPRFHTMTASKLSTILSKELHISEWHISDLALTGGCRFLPGFPGCPWSGKIVLKSHFLWNHFKQLPAKYSPDFMIFNLPGGFSHARSLNHIEDQVYIFPTLFYSLLVSAHSRMTDSFSNCHNQIPWAGCHYNTLLMTRCKTFDMQHSETVLVPSCSLDICKNTMHMGNL